jgi:NH3-dependent NAD+ synthetase
LHALWRHGGRFRRDQRPCQNPGVQDGALAQCHDPYATGASPIPERIITRPPSAELRPDQKDQDSLPPYEVLDAIVDRYMENDQSIETIVSAGLHAGGRGEGHPADQAQ